MTLQGIFKFQNQDSTQDMNDRWSFLFGRGIFEGGVVTTVSNELQVQTAPFKAVAFDGMMVGDTATVLHTVVAGQSNWIVCRAKYNPTGNPTLAYEVLDTSTYNADPFKESLIVFARIDVPLLATEVESTNINVSVRDEITTLSRDAFRGIFPTSAVLPLAENNVLGDWVMITQGNDVPEVHVWNTVAWINATPATTLQTELTNHRNDVFSDEVHLTNDQADAVVGSAGSPDSGNLFVTEEDTRLPVQGENDALVGTRGTPGTGNPYVSSAHVVAVAQEIEFGSAPTPANRITLASGTSYYTGTGATGTAQQWFAVYNQNAFATGVYSNAGGQNVIIIGLFTDTDMLVELDPSVNISVDSDGFFNGATIYAKTDNNIDSGFRLAFGIKDDIGTRPVSVGIERGPKTYFIPAVGASPTGAIFGEQDTTVALFQFKFGDKSDVLGRYIPNVSFDSNTVWRRDNIFRNAISMEISKTQLMADTENFTTGWSTNNATSSTLEAYNWLDIKKAARLTATGASAEIFKTADTFGADTATRCYSIYAKAGTSTNIELRITYAGGTAPSAVVVYNLVDILSDASGSPTAPVAHGLDYASQGWYRCWLSLTSTSDTSVVVGMNPDSDDGNNFAYFDKAQLELGTYPSAWIPSAPGFRSAPSLGYDADFLADRGVLSIWGRRSDLDNTFDSPLFWNDNSVSAPTGPALMINTSGNLAFFNVGPGIVETATVTAVNDRNWHNYVYDYGLGKIWYDGALVHDASDAVVAPNIAEPIHVGTAAANVDKKFNGELTEFLAEAGAGDQDVIDGRVANGQVGRLQLLLPLNRPVRHYNIIDTTDGEQYAQDVDAIAVSELFLNPITNVDGTIHFASDAALFWNQAGGQFEFDRDVDIAGNITLTGTVDTVDVAALKSDVDGFPDELKSLTGAEIDELANIGATTISAGSWGHVGAMDQDVAAASTPTFASLTFDQSATGIILSHTTSDGLLRSAHHMTFVADDNNSGTNATFSWRINATTRAGAAEIMSLTEAGVLDVQGNITLTGTVDTVDVAGLKSDVDGFPDELKNLTGAEIDELANIGATAISAGSWGNVGAMDQDVAAASSPTFATLNVSGADIEFTGAASNRSIIFESGGASLDWVAASNGWLFDGITGSNSLAGLKVDRATTGVDRSMTLFNSAAAAINNASELAFSANRTTSGETIIGLITSTIVDIGQSTSDSKMEFSVALDSVPVEVMQIDPGLITITGSILPEANNTRDIGTSGTVYANVWATTFHGVSTAAQYSDLAEKYSNVNGEQPIGTLVSKTGERDPNYQVRTTFVECDFRVLGVVSENPGFVMNDSSEHQPIARVGMILVRVVGPIIKGDFLVSSSVVGCARAGTPTELPYKIGWADETNESLGEKLVNSII